MVPRTVVANGAGVGIRYACGDELKNLMMGGMSKTEQCRKNKCFCFVVF